jgi:hypothetical protein
MNEEERRRLGNATRHALRVKCLDCGRFRYARRHEFTRAARVRCTYCGGPTEVSDEGQKKMAASQDVVNESKNRMHRAQGDNRFWQDQTPQEAEVMTQDQLQAKHGTPSEFEAATWELFYNQKIEASDAMAAISRYRKQWVTAGDKAMKAHGAADDTPDITDTICASILEEGGKYAVLVHVDGGMNITQTKFKYKTLDEARTASDAILDRGMLLSKLMGLKLKRFSG